MQINIGIIRRCEQSFLRDRLAEYQLKPVDSLVLNSVQHQGTCNQEMLCSLLDVDKGRMARIMERLEGRGLIRRIVNPANKREKLVEMTEDGLAMCHTICSLFKEWNERCFIGFTEEEKAQYQRYQERIAHNALARKENARHD